jgi:hypothetical protein
VQCGHEFLVAPFLRGLTLTPEFFVLLIDLADEPRCIVHFSRQRQEQRDMLQRDRDGVWILCLPRPAQPFARSLTRSVNISQHNAIGGYVEVTNRQVRRVLLAWPDLQVLARQALRKLESGVDVALESGGPGSFRVTTPEAGAFLRSLNKQFPKM